MSTEDHDEPIETPYADRLYEITRSNSTGEISARFLIAVLNKKEAEDKLDNDLPNLCFDLALELFESNFNTDELLAIYRDHAIKFPQV